MNEQMTLATIRAVPVKAREYGDSEAEAVDLLFFGDS